MKAFGWFMALLAVSCSPHPRGPSTTALVRPDSAPRGQRIAAYCVGQSGGKVGDGECWTLANEAFIAAGARRPGGDLRVWGREVNPAVELLKPGDVIEFQNARFSDGTVTGSTHTAVVVIGGSQQKFAIAEQNWGRKTVRIREMDLTNRVSGTVRVYRPQ